MKQLSPVTFICRCRRKWHVGQNLHSGSDRKKRVYSSKYALSSIVYSFQVRGIFTAESHGTTGASTLRWRCCTRVEHGPNL